MLQGLQGVTSIHVATRKVHCWSSRVSILLWSHASLGTRSVSTLLHIYGHLLKGNDQDAADRLDESGRNPGEDQVADQTPPEGDRPHG